MGQLPSGMGGKDDFRSQIKKIMIMNGEVRKKKKKTTSTSQGRNLAFITILSTYRGVTKYPKLSSLKQHICIMSQFLRVRSLEAGGLGGYGSGFLMKLQAGCQPGLQSSEGWTHRRIHFQESSVTCFWEETLVPH